MEKLKIRRLLDQLDSFSGTGTSMVSLLIPAGGNINIVKQKMAHEFSDSARVKSRL
jgi:peptide subunit release factor 1 (eRF1)